MSRHNHTLKDWIEQEAAGEIVVAVVIGEMGWGEYNSDNVPNYAAQPRGKVLTWQEAVPWISYPFSSGYGAPQCNAITAWTKSWVIGVAQYDGSTSPFKMPRDPVDHMPIMPGD